MAIKQLFASNNARTDNGYQAFETLGRRVGGQYDQAGNDLRDIGRAKADVINMVGRWPFNIIDLEQRAAARAQKSTITSTGGGVRVAQSGKSITDEQFAPRVMPDLSALNEMSEGASTLGRGLRGGYGGGGSQLPYLAQKSRREAEQYNREQTRKLAAANAAYQKRWDLYEKDLSKYNAGIEKNAQDWYEKQPNGFSNEAQYRAQLETVNPSDNSTATGTINGILSPPLREPTTGGYPEPESPGFFGRIGNSVSSFFSGGGNYSDEDYGGGGGEYY